VNARAARGATVAREAGNAAPKLEVIQGGWTQARIKEFIDWIEQAIAPLFEAKKHDEAMSLAQVALNLDQMDSRGHLWAGVCLRSSGQYELAEEALTKALELKPESPLALANLGSLIYDLDPERALTLLGKALELNPSGDYIAQNYMLAVLTMGDYERGWNLYNRRTRFPAVGNQICKYPTTPVWDGRSKGKVLLVGEEGIGERVMFASMIQDVIEAGATPLIEVTSGFERFTPWYRRSFPKLKIAEGGKMIKIDYHINIGDLGAMFRRKVEDFPKHTGYMTWDEDRAQAFRERLSPGPIVGICYKSTAAAGPYKSIPLGELGPILQMPGVTFVDIQYDGTEEERNTAAPLINHLPDLDLRQDMDGVAALIGACDLIITVSSVAAHMAGAMGKPVWTFIPSRSGRMWFWGVEGDSTPWYPSMKLYRQSPEGSWTEAISQAESDLQSLVELTGGKTENAL